jgi:hypothetical protein
MRKWYLTPYGCILQVRVLVLTADCANQKTLKDKVGDSRESTGIFYLFIHSKF